MREQDRMRELDRLIAGVDPLVGRVVDNETARHGLNGFSRTKQRRRRTETVDSSIFQRSLTRTLHPLDRRYQCGFDPHNVSMKKYVQHISHCSDGDCELRWYRHLQLKKELAG